MGVGGGREGVVEWWWSGRRWRGRWSRRRWETEVVEKVEEKGGGKGGGDGGGKGASSRGEREEVVERARF